MPKSIFRATPVLQVVQRLLAAGLSGAGRFHAQMLISIPRHTSAAGGSRQIAELHQVRFAYILQRHGFLSQRGGNGLQTNRAAAIHFNDGPQQAPVHLVQARVVDAHTLQRFPGDGFVDHAVAQHSGNVSLTSVYARKDFRLGGLHLDNRVLLQWSTNQEVAPVPLLSAFLSYYYEFWVVRNVLRLQIGLDGRYNTRYYAPGYNPALSAFYNQREVEVGNYPYVDAFVMGKWKRMRIFLKYQHVNKGLFGNGEYFSAANYPLNPGMFKIGISWGFYD